MPALVWLRRDLRLRDHSALLAARRASNDGVVAIFLLSPAQWREHDEAPAKVAFWLDNLRGLSEALAEKNIPLRIARADRFDDAPRVLRSLAREIGADSLWMHHEYEVNERRRDEAVTEALGEDGIEVHTLHDRCVLEPASIRTGQGDFYSVYTPYRKAWTQAFHEDDPAVGGRPRRQDSLGIDSDRVPDEVEGYAGATYRDDLWPAGERAAERRLERFLERHVDDYDDRRDQPAVEGTSGLSPYLAAGVISPRHCFARAREANHGRVDGGRKGLQVWMQELIWREFYTHVLVGAPWVSMHRAYQSYTEQVEWRDDREGLRAWKEGRTGVPIVDAAMRQLAETGWMHNRLRMITAQFLSKNLLVDWREGERHFMRHLVDGDLASNNGGWQWSASTGTDAAPYFRVFNPVRQSERFDPDGEFLRRHLPELEDLDTKALHDPSRLTPLERAGLGYPEPIVDLKRSRQRAIDAFQAVKGSS